MWPGSYLRPAPGQILIISTSGRCALLEPVTFSCPICQSMAQMQVKLLPRHARGDAGWQCVRACIFW